MRVQIFGLLLVLVGAVLMTLEVSHAGEVAIAGAVALIITRGVTAQRTDEVRHRRLLAIGVVSAFAMLAAGALYASGRNYWALPLLCAAAVETYVACRA